VAAASCSESGSPSSSNTSALRPDAAPFEPLDAAAPACPSPGATSSLDPGRRRGPPLVVGEFDGLRAPVWDAEGDTGIDGAAVIVQSSLGNANPGSQITAPARQSTQRGRLCAAGNTVIVPLMNLTEYWGMEISIYLISPTRGLLRPDAGSEPTPGPYAPLAAPFGPWDPAALDVIGFSFVIDGNDPELPCGGVPPTLRIESAPDGSALDRDIFCRAQPLISGAQDVLFSELTRDCWEPGGEPLLAEPLPPGFTGALLNLQWVVPADETNAYHFDFCVGDIRPIYGDRILPR
jgi:hypothetical protein